MTWRGKLRHNLVGLSGYIRQSTSIFQGLATAQQFQAILILVIILYCAIRFYNITEARDSQLVLLSLAPVLLAGYFFGMLVGLITSGLIIVLFFSFYYLIGGSNPEAFLAIGGLWGFIALVATGMGVGRLVDLRDQLKTELDQNKKTFEALKTDHEITRQTVENSPNAIFIVDRNLKIRSWNEACCMIFEYNQDIIGTSYNKLLWSENENQRIQIMLDDVFEEGRSFNSVEITYRSKTGAKRHTLASLFPMRSENGSPTGCVFANTDITSRVEAERILEESRERYRSLYEGVPVGLYRTTPDGRILDASPSLVEMLGYQSLEGLKAVRVYDFYVDPNDRDQENELIDQSGVVRDFDLQLRRRDGTAIWVRDSVRAVRDGQGEVLFYEGSLEDITPRKRAEESERQQRILAEALRDVAEALNSTLRFDEVLDRILVNIERVVPHEAALIMLVEGGYAHAVRSHGYEEGGPSSSGPVNKMVVANTPTLRQMAESRKPLAIPDTKNYPGWVDYPESRWLRSYCGAPILIKGETVGFINLNSGTPNFFNEFHLERLKAFADQAAIAIENARLFSEVQGNARQMALLNDITRTAISAPDLSIMLQSLADRLGELIGADGAYITLWDADNGLVIPKAAYGDKQSSYSKMHVQPGDLTMTASVLKEERALVAENVLESPYISANIASQFAEHSMLGLPLIADGKKLGAALISFKDYHNFKEEEIALCEQAAAQIALAISKVQSLEAERQRTSQLTRANALIMALGHVASKIESAIDPDEVIKTLGEELRELGIHCMILMRASEHNNLAVRYLSIEPEALAVVEKLSKQKIRKINISPESFRYFKRVILQKQAMFTREGMPSITPLFQNLTKATLKKIARLLGITLDTKSIFLPLIAEEQVLGTLMMWAIDLEESDLPAASLFASQVAIAMENARLYSKTQQMAITDELTGLYNRRGLFELGQREVERSLRFGYSVSLIILDIDHFKDVNDQFGHAAGDQVLRILAERCQRNIRGVDIIGRYGGEEFVILLSENQLDSAVQVAERLRERIVDQPFPTECGEIPITVSLGVSSISQDIHTLEGLISSADQALYVAKNSGRNSVVVTGTRLESV